MTTRWQLNIKNAMSFLFLIAGEWNDSITICAYKLQQLLSEQISHKMKKN